MEGPYKNLWANNLVGCLFWTSASKIGSNQKRNSWEVMSCLHCETYFYSKSLCVFSYTIFKKTFKKNKCDNLGSWEKKEIRQGWGKFICVGSIRYLNLKSWNYYTKDILNRIIRFLQQYKWWVCFSYIQ